MSYEIIYNKQFVKLNETEFIPIVLIGSNNCYDILPNGRQRRERNWYGLKNVLNGKCYGTLESMVAKCENEREGYIKDNEQQIAKYGESYGRYTDNSYGYYASLAIGGSTRKTTFGKYKGIFTDGVKKAMTVEELRDNGITIEVTSGYTDDKELKEHNKERRNHYPITSLELKNKIDEYEEYYKGTPIGFFVTINSDPERVLRMQQIRNRLSKQTKVKTPKEVKEEFVFKMEGGGYFVKGTRNGLNYTYDLSYLSKRVYNEKTANRVCKTLNEKHNKKFVVEKVILQTPKTILV